MKFNKQFLSVVVSIIPILTFSQSTGVNTLNPQGVFHVDSANDNAVFGIPTATQQSNDFIITSGGNAGIGTISPLAKLDVNGNVKIRSITTVGGRPDYLLSTDADGSVNKFFFNELVPRFLGGTAYVLFGDGFQYNTVWYDGTNYVYGPKPLIGSLGAEKIIGKKSGSRYNVGALNLYSSVGQIMSIKGRGYTISSPVPGIFDIIFDAPFNEIYGVCVNVLDSYSYSSNGTAPIPDQPGNALATNDNAQVAFISNAVLRVKTGDSQGKLGNRSFTFLVTGN